MRFLRAAGLLLVLFAVVAAAASLILGRSGPSGSDWLARQVSALASGPGRTVTIGRVEGWPWDVQVADVSVADPTGVWLTIDHAALLWRPLDLLHRVIVIDRLQAGTITVARAPVAEAATPSPLHQPGLEFPHLPVGLRIARIALDRLVLGPALAGQAAALSVTGQAGATRSDGSATGGATTLELAIQRLDATPGTVTVTAAFRPDAQTLALTLHAHEDPGGLVATLLSLPDGPAVNADLTGSGPLSDWSAQLHLQAGPLLDAAATAAIRRVPDDPAYHLTLDAGGTLQAVIPQALRPMVGDRPALSLRADLDPNAPGGTSITLQPSALTLASGTVTVSGTANTGSGHLDLTASGRVDNAAPFHDLLPGISFEAVQGSGRVTGSLATPTLDATVTTDGLATGDVSSHRTTITAHAQARGALNDPAATIDATLQARITGLTAADPRVAQASGPDVALDLATQIHPGDGTIALSSMSLTTAIATLTARGQATGWGDQADATAHLDLGDLATLPAIPGVTPSGRMAIDATVTGHDHGADLHGSVRGEGHDVRTGIAAIDSLLSGAVTLGATVTQQADGTLDAPDLLLTTGGIDVRGRLHRDADRRIDGGWKVVLSGLPALGHALDLPLAGRITSEGTVKGTPDALSATVTVTGDHVAIGDHPVGGLRLESAMAGLPAAAKGSVSLTTRPDGPASAPAVALAASIAMTGQTVAVDHLRLDSGTNHVTGAARYDGTATTLAGHLHGDLADLAALGAATGQPLSGAATLDLTLDSAGGHQNAHTTLAAQGLSFGATRIGHAEATADLRDVTGKASIVAALRLADAATDGAVLTEASARLSGGISQADLTVETSGRTTGATPEPITLAMTATIGQNGTTQRLHLTRLEARYADQPITLTQPATIERTGGAAPALSIQTLILHGRQGRIAIDLAAGSRNWTGTATATQIPLALARLAAPDAGALGGSLDATLSLAGTPAQPRADLSAQVTGLRSDRQPSLGSIAGTLQAHWRDGRVTLEGESRSDTKSLDVKVKGSLPLTLDPGTFTVALPPAQPVQVAITGRVDLSPVNDFLAATGDHAEGVATIDLAAAGPVNAPQLSGSATLTGGRYDNLLSGATLSGITARLSGNGDHLRLERFHAETADRGTLDGQGAIGLDPGSDHQIDLSLTARQARIVQNDLATVVVDADMTVAGTLRQAIVKGQVRVDTAEIRIPDDLPPQVAQLDVTEINSHERTAAASPLSRTGIPIPGHKPPRGPVAGTAPAVASAGPMRIALDLALHADKRVFIRGRGIDAEMTGDVAASGTADQPILAGALNLDHGQIDVLAKQFTFQRGRIVFPGDASLDPTLDLSAQASTSSITATVDVTGTASSPQIAFSSSPPLPQDEVLSRVLFNESSSQISAFQALQLAQSVAQLSGVGGGGGTGMIAKVRDWLGLDRLGLVNQTDSTTGTTSGTTTSSSTSSGTGALSGAAVSAGRYITPGVYVGVQQGAGTTTSRANVELTVTPSVKAQIDVGANGDEQIGLKFERDY
ncbi:MAG: translocation/assembly module TamB domain-containing protein [Azospirillaceae bacterium]|nr:translocation/assembly module TamB domain-containing protein [Azospirillaceae bacterium]